MNSGFYKRRRGILEHLEAGKISLLDLAIHDYLNLKANLVIGNSSAIPPGICITSSVAIHATCPRQISERAVQRSLEHLESIGWIKRWNERGKRGNYPVLVCRCSVHDLSGNEYRVNGEKTTDWRHPVREPVGELSPLGPKADAELSGNRERRSKKGEKNPAAKTAPPADPRFQPFFEFAYEAFRTKHDQPPTWGGKDKNNLKQFLKEQPGILLSEWERRFGNYLDSTERFIKGRGCGLAYFVTNFDAFRDGPILAFTGGTNGKGRTNRTDTLRDIAASLGVGTGTRPA